MPATFDGVNLLVTLPATVNGVLSIDIARDLYSDWKEFTLLAQNLKYPELFRQSVGGDTLQGSLQAGAYFFMQNTKGWRIRPFEGDGEYTFLGNLIAEDETLPMILPTVGAFTVLINGLQPITQNVSAKDVEHASFNNGVTIDVVKGTSGTLGTVGNERQPSNNLTDAKTIAANRGLSKFYIVGIITFGATDVLDGFSVIGVSRITSNVFTFISGCSTMDTKLQDCTAVGTLKGRIDAHDVVFGAIVDMDYDSWLMDCWFGADVSLKGDGNFAVINCGATHPPGTTARPTLDYAQVPLAKSNFLRWSGNIGFKNVTAGNIELNIGSGKVFLESTNTGGNILIRSKHSDIDDETPIGGLQVISELERFAVVADAGNTATTFKTNLTSTQTDLYKDSIVQVLNTIAGAGLVGEVKKVLSYNATTKFITLTSALSGIPADNTKFKVINE